MQKKTYLQQCLKKEKLIRWIDSTMPLAVYIAPFRFYSKAHEDYKYRNLVLKALQEWQQASGGKCTFKIVDTLLNSQINIDWKRVDRQALGHCYFNYDAGNRLFSAEVHIGITDGIIHQEYMNEDEVYHTILHEIGHALGLDHSPNKNDIMYTPHQYGVIKLSQGDKSTLRWLYKLPANISVPEVASKYGIPSTDIDDIIAKLIARNEPSEFEKVKSDLVKGGKDLLEEQANIADLKKYNMALQNIKIDENIRKIFINQPKTEKKY